MAKINYEKVETKEAAYDAVKKSLTAEKIAKFGVTADLDYDETGKTIIAKGKGFKLTLNFFDREVESDLDLSFILKPMKGKVNNYVETEIRKVV